MALTPTANKPVSSATFAHKVVAWQRQHGRNNLPWCDQDAYSVWLSEVMLQQTQVNTVLPYYATFKTRFPSIHDLAAAAIDEVLALWAGLGYYSRARNLHRCAVLVCDLYGGVFPSDLQALQALPGIGPSTAAAIASLAQGQRAAILDGNVKRVMARHAGIVGWAGLGAINKRLWTTAQARLVSAEMTVASDFHRRYTQGLMDLGATVCHAKKPLCEQCPIAIDCAALLLGQTTEVPTPRPKKITPKQWRDAVVLHTQHGVWLERRPAQGLWGGLLCLPEAQDKPAVDVLVADLLRGRGITPDLLPWSVHHLKHTFTHYQLHWTVWAVNVENNINASFTLPAPWVFAPWADIPTIGVPKAVLKVLSPQKPAA